MPLASFETPLESTTTRAFHDGPILECAPPTTSPGQDTPDPTLRIRAHRVYPASREELFASWTRRTAWDSWMRLRSRSRSTLSPCRGGAFRLELAEGPAIHVITGVVHDIRPDELLSLGWVHQNTNDHGSTVDVTFQSAHGGTALTLVHRGITSRREASWLMRLWSAVLGRLETYVAGGVVSSTRRISDAPAGFARSAGLVFALTCLSLHQASTQPSSDSARAREARHAACTCASAAATDRRGGYVHAVRRASSDA